MDHNLARDGTRLGEQILKIYMRAVSARQPKVAEQLLGALEELARSHSACRGILDEAYLLIGHPIPGLRGRTMSPGAVTACARPRAARPVVPRRRAGRP